MAAEVAAVSAEAVAVVGQSSFCEAVAVLQVPEEMAKTIDEPGQPSRFVPQAFHVSIMPSAVGSLIGPRGANIKAITENTGARVSVDDSGAVLIYATDQASASRAKEMVQQSAGVLSGRLRRRRGRAVAERGHHAPGGARVRRPRVPSGARPSASAVEGQGKGRQQGPQRRQRLQRQGRQGQGLRQRAQGQARVRPSPMAGASLVRGCRQRGAGAGAGAGLAAAFLAGGAGGSSFAA